MNRAEQSHDSQLLGRIRAAYPSMKRAQRRIADIVLQDPQACLTSSVMELAADAAVSEPSVIRFARSFGYQGYREFKLKLAQSLVGFPFVVGSIHPDASFAEIARHVTNSSAAILIEAGRALDCRTFEQAARMITDSARIVLFGIGISGVVADECAQELIRLGKNSQAYRDPETQLVVAAGLLPTDCVLAISSSGRTHDVINAVRTAKKSGARVIAISRFATPLSEEAECAICVDSVDDPEVHMPSAARLVQLLVVDIIVAALAVRYDSSMKDHVENVKQLVNARRV